MVGSTAYKKWEKAAIAGVSLVADAAEQLEHANLNKDHSIALPNMICSHNGECPSKCTVNNKVQQAILVTIEVSILRFDTIQIYTLYL
jgi:hypothetical protein